MKDHFALLPYVGGSVTVEGTSYGVELYVDGQSTDLTPSEARQVAAALTRLAALRPVPAA